MDIVEGTLEHDLPYYAFGAGEPLVVLRWFTPDHANPTGLERRSELKALEDLGRSFRVFAVNRAPHMPAGTTMADIANDHADAIRKQFGEAVHVLGMSSGGSLALQLAVDHPDVVRKLVIAGSAYTLSEKTRAVQRDYTEAVAAGKRGAHLQAPVTVGTKLEQALLVPVLWLTDPLLRPEDPQDMLHFAQAEDSFDVGDRLGDISMPTLVIGGDRDLAYSTELFRATAEGIPGAELIIYPKAGHIGTFTNKRYVDDVTSFLQGKNVQK